MSIIQMLIAQMFSDEDVGDIGHSLRFRGSASAYMSRTFGTPTDNKKWTWSGWIKRGTIQASTGQMVLFGAGAGLARDSLGFGDEGGGVNTLQFYLRNGSGARGRYVTSSVYRDPSSHMHVLLVYDSANVTAGNRVLLYVNGVSVALTTAVQLPLNENSYTNQAGVDVLLGQIASSHYLDGYLSRVCFVDGQALTPSSFGYFNTNINEWVSNSQSAVKAVVDAGGTNSFMLDFDNGTSTTTLGYDKSSKGNNLTCNNISLTAGSTYDWMLDVPGNSYATWSPLDKGTITVAEGNLSAVSAADTHAIRGSIGLPQSGKWYWEITVSGLGFGVGIGIADNASNTSTGAASAATRTYQFGSWFNTFNSGVVHYGTNQAVTGGSNWSSASQSAANDVLMVAVDMDNGSMWVGRNGTWFNSSGTANPATNTDPRWTGLTGTTWFPYMAGYGTVTPVTCHLNAGQRPFTHTPPSGFSSLNQTNLAASGSVTVSGTFTGNANADGPFVWINGVPDTLTINSNAVTFGTHADKLAGGFKLRTSSASYNVAGSNTWTATITSDTKNIFKYNTAEGNP